MTLLSINLNKVALIRNSRGRNYPDLVQVALDCVRFGADGITLHPRPDERHARKADVYALKEALGGASWFGDGPIGPAHHDTPDAPLVTLSSGDPGAERREHRVVEGRQAGVELNVEGYPSEDFLRLIEATRPAQCTLVPDAPDALTSNAGWDTRRQAHFLLDVVMRIQAAGVRASLFVEPDLDAIEGAREIGADRIELYTEHFASAFALGDTSPVEAYARSAAYAHELGLGINAGHDLNLDNLAFFAQHVPHVAEVSIGHALVTDALYLGFEETIRRYQGCLGK